MRLDASNFGLAQGEIGAGNIGAFGGKHADQALTGIRRAADHLLNARAGLDLADAQLVGIRVLLGGNHFGDGKILQACSRIDDLLNLKTDDRELIENLIKGNLRRQMIPQPGKCEFHRLSPPASVGTSSGKKP